VLDLAIQIANEVEAAHKKGIIHRDIRLGNIFVSSHGQAKILGFALAVIENSLYSTPLRALAQNPRTLFQATKSRLVST
jgi:serine/threonine protein kinase